MEFDVNTTCQQQQGSIARCKQASLVLDTDMEGRSDAFNPAELLLASLSACIIKGIVRVAPIIKFSLRELEVRIHGTRQDVPPKMASISYEVIIDTDEPDHRLNLLHENIRKYGTVYNTLVPGTSISGTITRQREA